MLFFSAKNAGPAGESCAMKNRQAAYVFILRGRQTLVNDLSPRTAAVGVLKNIWYDKAVLSFQLLRGIGTGTCRSA